MWPFKKKPEQRNYTSQVMDYRMAEIHGRRGLADLTGTVQGCVSLWEAGLSQAAVTGTDALKPRLMALVGRELALRGEAVLYLPTLTPAYQWDLSTKDGNPTAYQLTLPDITGGRAVTALAGEVLHIRIGSRASMPWYGTAPLQRASLTAGLLHALETALQDVYADAPLGSQVMPMPESSGITSEELQRSFRGRRGGVLLPESTNVAAAGGPAPSTDWKPSDLSPNLRDAMTSESLQAARGSILNIYGVLPALLNHQSAGPVIREAERHLNAWTLQPIATVIADEASTKLGTDVRIDTMTPMHSMDTAGRARALSAMVKAMAEAKEAGLNPEQLASAMQFAGTD